LALRELLANAEAIFRVECAFESSGRTDAIKLAASTHLYRIAQEAISNATRHGHARHIWLQLRMDADRLTMRISDDGSGIESSAPSTNGMGLRIMQYRARMIDASIDVAARNEGGTTITCTYRPTESTYEHDQHINQG
jgi:signal transduction histidine kinase